MWYFLWLFFFEGVLCIENALEISPSSLTAWKGSCVLFPCQIKASYDSLRIRNISLIWFWNPTWDNDLKEYHGTMLYNGSVTSVNYMTSTSPIFRDRVKLVGDLHSRNCSLKISELQESDNGTFGARLYGFVEHELRIQKWFHGASLSFSGSPPQPSIVFSPGQIVEKIRNRVTCSVSYHCPDEPVVVILRGLEKERVLHETTTYEDRVVKTELTLNPTWQDHRKKLTCVLKSHNGTEISQRTVELDVKHSPKGVQLNATPGVTVQEGKNLLLKCLVNSSSPAVFEYQWNMDGHRISAGENKDTVEFNPVQEQHSGRYKCGARNEFGLNVSEELTIDVQYPPKETKVECLACTNIKEKDRVELRCSSKGNPTVSHYEWYKYNESSVISTHEKLCFERIQPSDSSSYFCKVYNDVGNSTSPPVILNVQYGPKDVQLAVLNHFPIKEGDTVTLNCSVGSSNPRRNGYKLLNAANNKTVASKIESNLIRITAKPEPTTSYKCEVCNGIACNTSPAVTVNVYFGPKNVIAVQQPPGNIDEGSYVKLSCTVETANPRDIAYVWYKDRNQVISANTTLTIWKATARDSGTYHCEAKNSVGASRSLPVSLDVRYGPRNIHVSLNIKEAIIEGKDVFLRCENSANPSASVYKWYRNGEEIAQKINPVLELRKVQVWQSGDYFCKVSNEVAEGESLPLVISVSYSRSTVLKQTLIGLGIVLALIVLLGLPIHALRRWKKNIGSDTGRTQRSGSFFVKKVKGETLCDNNNRRNEVGANGSVEFLNQDTEGSITYATVKLPPSFSGDRVVYSSIKQPRLAANPSDEHMIYSAVKKPGIPAKGDTKPDYENVEKMEEELHYSSLVNLTPWRRPTYVDSETDSESEDSIQYAALKH